MHRLAALVLVGSLTFGTAVAGQGVAKPATLTWAPAPAAFPAGAMMAVVSGDPGKPGPFMIQISMPDGYKVMPHTHPADETVSVLSGTLLLGMGDTWDATKAKAIAAGADGKIAANMWHFAGAKGKTVIQVSSMGPFAMNYVNPADDPRNKSK